MDDEEDRRHHRHGDADAEPDPFECVLAFGFHEERGEDHDDDARLEALAQTDQSTAEQLCGDRRRGPCGEN